MSIHAGSIVHVGGGNTIDRIQSAGLGDVRVPTEAIMEVGNDKIVDKVPGDADFTWTLNTLDVSTEVEAWLTGKIAAGSAPASAAGFADAAGTEYKFSDFAFVNVESQWKAPRSGSAGTIEAGHLIPGYYCSRVRYQFGVSANSSEEFTLSGGSYYYNGNAPVEDQFSGTGFQTAFVSTRAAVPYRKGGVTGSSFRSLFGVIVNGDLQTEGVDFTQSPSDTSAPATATVTFTVAPASGADIRFCYFTTAAVAEPDTVHASTVVKPAAVRGRHICIFLGSGGSRQKVGSVQTATLEASLNATAEREFCNEEIVGVTINSRDCSGDLVVRSKNSAAFLALCAKVTGVAVAEVQGWLNTHALPLEIVILSPKDPAVVLKTLYVSDALFQVPGVNAQANQPTDFTFHYESQSGDFSIFKAAKP